MITTKDILLKILEIIGYEDDKEAFVNAFLVNIQLQALNALLAEVPPEKKSEIEKEITSDSPDKYQVLQSHFTQEQIEKALNESADKAVQEYIESIDETLTEDQRQGLVAYVEGLEKV